MAQERLRLLPEEHPARKVEAVARTRKDTWASTVLQARGDFGVDGATEVRGGVATRQQLKSALKKYRQEVVRPALEAERDNKWWQEHGAESGRHQEYYDMSAGRAALPEQLAVGADAQEWRDYAYGHELGFP